VNRPSYRCKCCPESGAAKNTVAEVLKAFEECRKSVTVGRRSFTFGFLFSSVSSEKLAPPQPTDRRSHSGPGVTCAKVSIVSTFKRRQGAQCRPRLNENPGRTRVFV